MHHAPCPSLSLSFEIIFRILRRKSLESAHSGFEILLEKKNPRVLDLRNTRVSHGSRKNSVHGERIGKNPPSFGRFSFLTFARGREKRLFPWLTQRCYFSFRGRKSFLFFIFHSDVSLQRKRGRERERREGKREDRSKIVEMVRQRPSVGGAASRRT